MSVITIEEPPENRPSSWNVFFAAGFRPFFLFTGLQAVITLPLWLAVYVGGVSLHLPFADSLWHGHEMLYGFAAAAIGGFLLTAVPSWTGTAYVSGPVLAVLSACWLAGRVGFTLAGFVPLPVVALVDLAYLPLLMVLVGRPLLRAGKMRNLAFVPILGLFWLLNVLFYANLLLAGGMAVNSLYAAIALVLLLIVIVGGRVIPSFTQNWLHMQGRQRYDVSGFGWIERGGAAASLLLSMLALVLWPESLITAGLLLVAAVVHGLRLSRWYGWKTGRNPIVWILHVGYGWLVVGLLVLAFSVVEPSFPLSSAVHALTAGCIASMIMAIMTRASLGHSGRLLQVSPAITIAYGLLSVGTLLRVIAPVTGSAQIGLTHGGGALWSMAWLLFVIVYFPILTKPRVDGRPG